MLFERQHPNNKAKPITDRKEAKALKAIGSLRQNIKIFIQTTNNWDERTRHRKREAIKQKWEHIMFHYTEQMEVNELTTEATHRLKQTKALTTGHTPNGQTNNGNSQTWLQQTRIIYSAIQ